MDNDQTEWSNQMPATAEQLSELIDLAVHLDLKQLDQLLAEAARLAKRSAA